MVMYAIEPHSVASWGNCDGHKVPASVDVVCPHCRRLLTFTLAGYNGHHLAGLPVGSRCPACGEGVRFFVFDAPPTDSPDEFPKTFLFPSPPHRPTLDTASIPETLRPAFESSRRVLLVGEWNAAAVMCRRTLEGITKEKLPKELRDKPLAEQLRLLPEHVDLGQPIKEIGDALKEGGNLAAHFDLEREADEPLATEMVELLEYLIEYLFIVPARLRSLETQLARDANPRS
jgi:Domain of unknown function (DUF4145)